VATQRTLLAVHAHPDDETITMGGTLARYSAEGVRTVVVTCTTGDLGAAAEVRARELEAASRVLGISRVVQLGYGDSGMAGDPLNHRDGAFWSADLQSPAAQLLRILEEERPRVVVTYDESGGYGHPDHLKANLVTCEALRHFSGPRLFFVRFPLTWSRDYVASLRKAGIEAPGSAPAGAGSDLDEIGTPDELVTTRVDVREYVQTKRRAIECYASQLAPTHWLRAMSDDLASRLWGREFYSLEGTEEPPPPVDLFGGT
jgi:LmbE family N-acetylglucosaminyl deacetylase